jgi:hypothetical protein
MVEVPAVGFPGHGDAYPAASSVVQPRSRSAGRNLTTRASIRTGPLALNAVRRTWNRERIGFDSELRCECTRPSCTYRVPAVAEKHRSAADQFLVAPAHLDGGVVVRAADRYFIVDSRGPAIRHAAQPDQGRGG